MAPLRGEEGGTELDSLMGPLTATSRGADTPPDEDGPDAPFHPRQVYSVEGPWGVLEFYTIHLMAPDRYMEMMQPDSETTEWVFEDLSLSEIGEFLETLGVGGDGYTDEERAVRYTIEGTTARIFPSDALLLKLTPEARATLAARLSDDDRNPHYASPVVVDSGDPAQWFRDAGLSEENVELISSLCYQRGDVTLFSDLPHVLSVQPTEADRKKVLRAATRTRSLVARLNVSESTDMQQVVDYWRAGYKRKALMPIFESVGEVESVERIDIAHLLPPIPRMLLYTYPSLVSLARGESRNCHWTSRNFFSPMLTSAPRASGASLSAILETHEKVEGDPEFGDTLLVTAADDESDVLHSMTHIAADIVFTKNGGSIFQPWVLMHYQDVLKRYTFGTEAAVHVYRLRED